MIINTFKKKKFIKSILNLIYYLRYLIIIFIFSIILLFILPKLFQHVNKIDNLNSVLKNQHGLIIKKTKQIKYRIFPQPHLEIKDGYIFLKDNNSRIKIDELLIFIDMKSFYIPEKLLLKKIKYKLNFFGNELNGNYIPKKNNNLINFEIKNLGVKSKVFLNKNKKLSNLSGSMKLKILDENLVVYFNYDNILKLKNSTYKNKNILANFNGQFKFEPFFYFKISADIKKINLKKIKLQNFYYFIDKELSNQKINGELNINYLKKGITKKENDKNSRAHVFFSNGEIISKISNFDFANIKVGLNLNLKKYPTYKNLDYELSLQTKDINKFNKIVGLKNKKNISKVNSFVEGNVNLDAQKFYFNKIVVNGKKYEDVKLKKFKNYFEKNITNLFYQNFSEKSVYLFLKDLLETI